MAFLTQLTVWNYKSIATCRVKLGPLSFLVGPNGSGKSNVLDCVRFVAESLRTSLDHALRDRGTIKEVRRRSGGHPRHFALRLDFNLRDGSSGYYAFRIGAKSSGGYEVQNEELNVVSASNGLGEHYFHVRSGELVASSMRAAPAAVGDRLYLVAASGQPEFRAAYEELSRMEVYNLNPREIGGMQKPDAGLLLRRDGSNAASVLEKLPKQARASISDYISRIVPGVSSPETRILGSQETVEFRQTVRGQKAPWRFYAASMSDGTLRAFGILLSLFQTADRNDSPPLVGLEEPETALHPAATGVLLASLREASKKTQILVTSHSPDLLDNTDIPTESILAVANVEGVTQIGPIDQAGRDVLKEHLFTAGELLRKGQLAPDEKAVSEISDERQLKLFEREL